VLPGALRLCKACLAPVQFLAARDLPLQEVNNNSD
jgi:hypothetical protein